jgi:hypothetical protein
LEEEVFALSGIAIFAGIAGLRVAATLSESFEYMVVPAKPGNPRNSEADILRLCDGRLMLAWMDSCARAGCHTRPHVRIYHHRVPERQGAVHVLRRTSAGKQGGTVVIETESGPTGLVLPLTIRALLEEGNTPLVKSIRFGPEEDAGQLRFKRSGTAAALGRCMQALEPGVVSPTESAVCLVRGRRFKDPASGDRAGDPQ